MPAIENPRQRLAAVALATSAIALTLPAAAVAAPPPVTVDPGGPSGKEYALPLNSARHDAGGGDRTGGPGAAGSRSGSGTSSSAQPAPPFGIGISSRSGTTPGSGGKLGGTASAGSRTSHEPAAGRSSPTFVHDASAADSGSSTLTLTGAIVGGMLLVGLAGGLLMRRLGRPSG
jgi:opacity protein-like surface antigen